ncbi:hypothetical protein PLIIFM63780_002096 [Purpureocillium lilacinum]|nr:hypothetical protein PLIIFM63780_002096 [Purpureocillium lilacinum]
MSQQEMPVIVIQKTYQGLKGMNGGGYTAPGVIIDKTSRGYRVSAGITIHFGPSASVSLHRRHSG